MRKSKVTYSRAISKAIEHLKEAAKRNMTAGRFDEATMDYEHMAEAVGILADNPELSKAERLSHKRMRGVLDLAGQAQFRHAESDKGSREDYDQAHEYHGNASIIYKGNYERTHPSSEKEKMAESLDRHRGVGKRTGESRPQSQRKLGRCRTLADVL